MQMVYLSRDIIAIKELFSDEENLLVNLDSGDNKITLSFAFTPVRQQPDVRQTIAERERALK